MRLGTMQAVVDGLVSILVYALILFGVYKIYLISNEVSEIKELLRDIKRNTEEIPAAGATGSDSHEALMRTLAAEPARVPDQVIG